MKKYDKIIKKCKFIAKPDTWFIENSEAKLGGENHEEYSKGDKFNNNSGLFNGLTDESYQGYIGELPREDGEVCPFDEFFIYDEFGNEISELTLEQYRIVLRKHKLKKLQNY